MVIIPAGVPRKPGMTRDDLFKINAGIVKSLIEATGKHCPKVGGMGAGDVAGWVGGRRMCWAGGGWPRGRVGACLGGAVGPTGFSCCLVWQPLGQLVETQARAWQGARCLGALGSPATHSSVAVPNRPPPPPPPPPPAQALLNIISNPVNSTVPIAAETLIKLGVYDPKRLFGVTTLDVVRAKTFYAEKAGIAVERVRGGRRREGQGGREGREEGEREGQGGAVCQALHGAVGSCAIQPQAQGRQCCSLGVCSRGWNQFCETHG